MANVKITALDHISSVQLAPEDVFVIDDVSVLVTKKVTLSNVTRYVSSAVGVDTVQENLTSFASYANTNAAALASAIDSVSGSLEVDFNISANTGTSVITLGSDTLSIVGSNGITSNIVNDTITVSMLPTTVTAGLYGGITGSTTQVPSFTVDDTGRITSAQNIALQVDFQSVEANINSVSSNVSSLNNTVTNINNSIGDLDNLVTTEKSNLVAAINEASSNAILSSITLDTFTIDTTVSSNVSSLGSAVFVMDKNTNKFAKLIVNVDDLTYGQQQSSEILLVQDGNSVKITEYAIVYTSTNPIAIFDATIDGDNIVLNATPSSADNIIKVYKILS